MNLKNGFFLVLGVVGLQAPLSYGQEAQGQGDIYLQIAMEICREFPTRNCDELPQALASGSVNKVQLRELYGYSMDAIWRRMSERGIRPPSGPISGTTVIPAAPASPYASSISESETPFSQTYVISWEGMERSMDWGCESMHWTSNWAFADFQSDTRLLPWVQVESCRVVGPARSRRREDVAMEAVVTVNNLRRNSRYVVYFQGSPLQTDGAVISRYRARSTPQVRFYAGPILELYTSSAMYTTPWSTMVIETQ